MKVNLTKTLTLIALMDLKCHKPLSWIVLTFLKGVVLVTLIALTEVAVLKGL